MELPGHVVTRRRDGRREIVLHRAMAVIDPRVVEIRGSRGAVVLPVAGLLVVAGFCAWIAQSRGSLGFWPTVALLVACLAITPLSVMGLVSSLLGADVVVDGRKGTVVWQQHYLGMGIGTRELVPFARIERLEVTIEGHEPDRWKGHADALRQFALKLVKTSGRDLTIAQVPVPASGQEDGMDRVLATGQAIAAITGSRLDIPAGWELVPLDPAPATADRGQASNPDASGMTRHPRRRRRRG